MKLTWIESHTEFKSSTRVKNQLTRRENKRRTSERIEESKRDEDGQPGTSNDL